MNNKKLIFMLSVIMLLTTTISGCINPGPAEPIEVVEQLDAIQYQGLWYSVYEIPIFYGFFPFGYSSTKCINSTATYTVLSETTIEVLNKCILRGKQMEVEGVARYENNSNMNGALIVNFFGFDSDYNVIGLDSQYQWAVVGTKNRENLWFLSRTPTIEPSLLEHMKSIAEDQGFDTTQLVEVLRE